MCVLCVICCYMWYSAKASEAWKKMTGPKLVAKVLLNCDQAPPKTSPLPGMVFQIWKDSV